MKEIPGAGLAACSLRGRLLGPRLPGRPSPVVSPPAPETGSKGTATQGLSPHFLAQEAGGSPVGL